MMRTETEGSRPTGDEEFRAPPSAQLFVKRKVDPNAAAAEVIRRPSISYWQDARMRLAKNRVAVTSAVFIVILTIAAAVVPEIIPFTYDEQEIWNKHALPNLGEEASVVADPDVTYVPVTVTPVVDDSGAMMTDPPPAPENLRIEGEPTTVGITMQWDPVPGVDGYRIYRSISADTLGVPIEDVQPEQVSFRDSSSLSSGETYHYFVVGFNAFGDSLEPAHVSTAPKFSLTLDIAQHINPDVKVGDKVFTKPHYFGTDYLGRDLLARVMVGARISLLIGFVVPILYMLIGIIFGSIAGFFGGLIDEIMMRTADVVATVPELLVVILLQVVMGSGLTTLIIALVAGSWSRSARQIRGEVMRLREMEFVHASKVLGTNFPTIIFRHLLPNVMGTVLVLLTMGVPYAIFSEAFLSFIGLGIAPPMASWGVVAKEGARVFLTYPHELLIPSVLICLTMLAFNLLGDGLRDALDPKLRGAK